MSGVCPHGQVYDAQMHMQCISLAYIPRMPPIRNIQCAICNMHYVPYCICMQCASLSIFTNSMPPILKKQYPMCLLSTCILFMMHRCIYSICSTCIYGANFWCIHIRWEFGGNIFGNSAFYFR